MAAVLASPGARRGYGLWLTARSVELPAGTQDRATVDVSVDHMPALCLRGTCPGLPMSVIVTLPGQAVRPGLNADSAWILVGPAAYALRMDRITGHSSLPSPYWSGHAWTRMGPEGLPVGVLVRFREPRKPPRVLRFTGVRVGSTW